MGQHAEWEVVCKNRNTKIIMIRDLERSGCRSVTNDAEYVYACVTNGVRGWRVIYQVQDPNSEWWEIVRWAPDGRVEFRPWHGLVWDRLTRVEP